MGRRFREAYDSHLRLALSDVTVTATVVGLDPDEARDLARRALDPASDLSDLDLDAPDLDPPRRDVETAAVRAVFVALHAKASHVAEMVRGRSPVPGPR